MDIKPQINVGKRGGWELTFWKESGVNKELTDRYTVKPTPDGKGGWCYDWEVLTGNEGGAEREFLFLDEHLYKMVPDEARDHDGRLPTFEKKDVGVFGYSSNVFKEMELRWEMMSRLFVVPGFP